MNSELTNWGQSVTGIVIRDRCVLLARHTYGAGKGKLIVPGGYVNAGESPQQALCREFYEETGITVEPQEIIGVRFNRRDWYVAFRAEYVAGTARSDEDENSETLWVPIQEALVREDVPDLTKKLIRAALQDGGLRQMPYCAGESLEPTSFYCVQDKGNL